MRRGSRRDLTAATAVGTLRSRRRARRLRARPRPTAPRRARRASISSSSLALRTRASIASNGSTQLLQRLDLLHDGLRLLLVVPEIRRGHSLLELPQRVALGIQVKDTSCSSASCSACRLSCRARSLSAICLLRYDTSRPALNGRRLACARVVSLQDSGARRVADTPRRCASSDESPRRSSDRRRVCRSAHPESASSTRRTLARPDRRIPRSSS